MPAANTSNISTIQILRSYSNSAPLTLDDGQLAFSFVSNTLFIGSNTGIKVVSNPPTDVKAQEAYNQANTATVLANAAYFHANGAFLKANAAFDNSNTKLSLSGGTITGPISGPGESKLDFTTYGSNTAYLTTTNDDSTALFMGAGSAELYADTSVQIRANTKGTSQNWTFGAGGTLTFPDNTIQTTAYTPGGEIDELARATANAAYFHANGAFLKANASFNQANLTIGVDASQNVRLAFSNTRMDISDGVNASQNVRLAFSNTRMDISDGVNASQNIRLDFSNTRMTIIEGVDVTQNTRLTVLEGVDLSQNVSINTQNSFITIIQGVDVGQNARMTIIEGVDVTQNTRLTVSEGVDLSQNVRLDFSNTRMTIIENTDVSQNVRLAFSNTRMDISDGVNASQNVRLDFSNAAITIIQGVDTTQNTRLTVAEATDVSQNVRLDFSNTRMTIIEGVNTSQNSRMTIIEGTDTSQNNRMSIIEGVDVGQNTAIAATDGKMQAAYFHANGAFIRANSAFDAANLQIGVDNTQNTRMTVIEGTDVSQNARMTIIEGVDVTQNTNIANRLALTGAASQTVFGNVVFGNDVTVTGNLIILGNTISLNVSSLEVEDTLIQLGIGNYTTDALSIGYVGHYNDGTNAHAGFIRDSGTKEFYAFQGYTPETTGNVININAASFNKANIHGNWFKGNLIATTARVGGLDIGNFATAAYNQANTGTVLAQASFNLANATVGVDATQNTRITVIEGTNLSQNVRLDFSNTRMTIIDGVDATQNTAIAATDNKMQGAYNVANTADVRSVAAYFHANGAFFKANAAFDQANVTIGVDATQNTRMTVIEGTDVGQNSRMTIIENTDVSQNVRLAFSNTRMDISDGVNASQNVRLDYSNTALTIAQGVDNSQNVRLDFSNAAITIIQGVDVTQNTRLTVSEGVDLSQNVRLDYSNTALTIAQGVDDSQNVRLNFSNTAINQISSAWIANTVIVANSAGFLSNSVMRFDASNSQLHSMANLSIGTTVASAPLTVSKSFTLPTTSEQFGQLNSIAYTVADTGLKQNIRLNTLASHTSGILSDAISFLNLSTGGGVGGTTLNQYGFWARGDVSAGAAVTNAYNYFSNNSGGLGSPSNQYGFYAANLTKGLSSNYGFYGAVNTGNNAFNLYMAGTAPNYLAGSLTVANNVPSTSNTTGSLVVTGGLGVSGNTYLSGNVTVSNTSTNLNTLQISPGYYSQETYFGVTNSSTYGSIRYNVSPASGGAGHFFTTYGSPTSQGVIQFAAIATAGGSAVNYLQASGNTTGNGPVLTSQGSDNDINVSIVSKGLGTVRLISANGINFVAADSGAQTNFYWQAIGGQFTGILRSVGSTQDGLIQTGGTGGISLQTNNGAQTQFKATHTASAVNYVQVTGAATGGTPTVSAQGSDSNITLLLTGKGSGGIVFDNPGYGNYFSATSAGATTTNANHIRVTGTISGSPAVIGAVGSDTNIGINITPKGNGSANITSTANSTSNTSGALVVTGGIGVTGNVFLSSANNFATTTTQASYRLGWSDSYFMREVSNGNMVYTGPYFYINSAAYVSGILYTRGTIANDQGNTTVIFAGSSPVKIQNGTASSNTTTGALVVQGGVGISGALNATTKSFNIPHPTKEGKNLRYGSLEGPEFGVYVRGTLKGSNVIELPDYWTKLVDANTITVSLTPIGKYQKLSVKEVKDNTIIINSDGWFKKEIHCYYTVFGERADVDKLDVEV